MEYSDFLVWISRVSLSSFSVGSFVVPGLYLLVPPLFIGYPLQLDNWCSQLSPCLVCDQGQGEGEMEQDSRRVFYGI